MIDLVVIIGYFALMLTIGWRSRKQSAESYWVAERKHGITRITASLVATIFGASSTIGIIGLGYARGLTAVWWLLIGAIALIPFAFFLAEKVRALNVYTLPDILVNAYGRRAAAPAGLMISIAWCGIIAAQMIAGGKLISGVLNIDFGIALFITAVVFVIYTFWGGQLSVIKTDFYQLVLFIGGLFIVFTFLSFGAGSVWNDIPSTHLQFPINEQFGWYDLLVYYPLIIGLPYLVGPDIYSRAFCAKDGRTAKKAALLASIIIIPLAFLLAVLGILASIKFPTISPESAFPRTLDVIIPAGLKGLITAGFLGAIMSSADSCLISASTIFTLNVINPKKEISQKQKLLRTRTVLIVIGIISWIVATFEKGIISSLLLGYTVFVGGVVIPTLASFWKDKLKISSTAAFWAVVIGGATALFGKINDGVIMKFILTEKGTQLFENLLGLQFLSILPIIFSILTLTIVSRLNIKG